MTQFNRSQSNLGFPRPYADVLQSSATTASASVSFDVTDFDGVGAYFILSGKVFPGSGSTTVALKIRFAAPNDTGFVSTIAAASAISTTSNSILIIYPGAAKGSAMTAANIVLGAFPLPHAFTVLASLSTGATSKDVVFSLGMVTLY